MTSLHELAYIAMAGKDQLGLARIAGCQVSRNICKNFPKICRSRLVQWRRWPACPGPQSGLFGLTGPQRVGEKQLDMQKYRCALPVWAWSKLVRQVVGPVRTIHTSTSPCNAHQSSQALMHSNAHRRRDHLAPQSRSFRCRRPWMRRVRQATTEHTGILTY